MINMRKGLKRLAIAAAVPYFGFWTLWVIPPLFWLSECTNPQDGECQLTAEAAADRFWQSTTYGIVLPLLVLAVFLVARWVYRGFRD